MHSRRNGPRNSVARIAAAFSFAFFNQLTLEDKLILHLDELAYGGRRALCIYAPRRRVHHADMSTFMNDCTANLLCTFHGRLDSLGRGLCQKMTGGTKLSSSLVVGGGAFG